MKQAVKVTVCRVFNTDDMFDALQKLDGFHMDSTLWERGEPEISWHQATGKPEDEPYGGAWFTVSAPTITMTIEKAYRTAFKLWDDPPPLNDTP